LEGVIAPRFGFYFRAGIRRLGEIEVNRGIDKNFPQVRAMQIQNGIGRKMLAQEWKKALRLGLFFQAPHMTVVGSHRSKTAKGGATSIR
jgi:hypothetical protein